MIELRQAIPLNTPKGHGYAYFVADYGIDQDLVWTVFQDNGEIWSWRNRDVRAVKNITFNRITETKEQSC